MENKKYKYWQCNECKILYPVGARPDICICGNDMLVNSTKNTMVVLDALSDSEESCDCHMFVGGTGEPCPDCKKNGCGFCEGEDKE